MGRDSGRVPDYLFHKERESSLRQEFTTTLAVACDLLGCSGAWKEKDWGVEDKQNGEDTLLIDLSG